MRRRLPSGRVEVPPFACKVSFRKAREWLSSRQSVRLECSAETIGTDMVSVVVAVGKNCDLMYDSEAGTGLTGVQLVKVLGTRTLITAQQVVIVF